jgi:hypothetical protein
MSGECVRTAEVVDAVLAEPERVAEHLERCPRCRDVAMVARAIGDRQLASCGTPDLPSADAVFWRSRLRARHEAASAAAAPVRMWDVVALSATLAASGSVLWMAAPLLTHWAVMTALGLWVVAAPLGALTLLAWDRAGRRER